MVKDREEYRGDRLGLTAVTIGAALTYARRRAWGQPSELARGHPSRDGPDRKGTCSVTAPHPLDNPVRTSLAGPHARFAERRGNVSRYPADVCPFFAMPDVPDATDWADATELAGPGGRLMLAAVRVRPPSGWEIEMRGEGVQMTGDGVAGAADPEAVLLGSADVPEMLDLADRTKPGPFLARTVEMGTYLGIRHHGVLVAMAGERLHPPGWTEISAVCTDEGWRGLGLASRLVQALAAGIRARGEVPFLHAVATNLNAIRLYEELGFRLRRTAAFSVARRPVRA
jgi:ribosomal protein S18 acetylase RimI-like enzyme